MASQDRVPVAGSDRPPLPGARLVGPVDPHEPVEVTVLVRARARGSGGVKALSAEPAGEHGYLSREEYATLHGADPADLEKVQAFARAHGLRVGEASAARRSVTLSGTAEAMSAAFGVALGRYETGSGSYRGASGPVRLPSELAPIVEAVVGLDDRPHARPHGGTAP